MAGAVWLVLLGLAALDAGAQEDLGEPTGSSEKPTVASLHFDGVESIPARDLREGILTTAPDWRPWRRAPVFDEEDLREDLDRIVSIYRDRGYPEATARYRLDWRPSGKKVAVTIEVTEGDPLRLVAWEFEIPASWAPGGDRVQTLRQGLPAPGSVFGLVAYREARRDLLEAVAELGHPAARIEGGAEVDVSARTASVHWRLHPGPPVVFGEVSIVGLEDVEKRVVERELKIRPGEPYSSNALRRSEKRIFETGLFRSVAIQPMVPGPDDDVPTDETSEGEGRAMVWPLEVRVVERLPRSARVGVGYGTEDLFRAQATWSHRNVLGGGERLSLGGKYSDLVRGGELGLSKPYFFDRPARLDVRLSAVQETPRAYTALRVGETVEVEFPLGRGFKGRVGQGVEFSDVTSQRFDLGGVELPDTTRLSTLLAGVRRSTLDDRIDPRRGTWFDFAVEPSLVAIGSEVDYVKLSLEARGFVPLGPIVLGGRTRIATLQPVLSSDRQDIPSFKRLFSGGSTSVRGFQYQKLGPRDLQGDPTGGLSLAEASIELRFPIYGRLRGVLFSDAGDVQLGPFDWNPNDLFYSSGLGLRIATPVGPLRVDVARLYNPPNGIGRYAFYFSVGHTF